MCRSKLVSVIIFFLLFNLNAQNKPAFKSLDVFKLEYAVDPQISPMGDYIVYKRVHLDIMKDKALGELWLIDLKTNKQSKLTSLLTTESQARWSPQGDKIIFTSGTKEEGTEIYMYWLKTGKVAQLTHLPSSPSNLTWSPNGKDIAFNMFVPENPPVIAHLPKKPKGADWVTAPRITDRLKHEADGRGYLKPGYTHIFILSAEGGSERQLTFGKYNDRGGLSWSSDGKAIYFSGNRTKDWEYDFRNSEIYKLTIASKEINVLTSRKGPDYSPKASSDGKYIAYLAYTDKVQTYQVRHLYIMKPNGKGLKNITKNFDRSISNITWNAKNEAIYFTYDDHGTTYLAKTDLNGKITKLTGNIGGTTIGRPYPSGSYSVAANESLVFTHTTSKDPSNVALLKVNKNKATLLTNLNDDVLPYINLGEVKEIKYKSTVDGRPIQGWLVYPPNYNSQKPYKLIVENHGGPILNYGPRFSTEMQLLAAAGYVVFYPNPRGSTGYGETFGNLLYNNYPGDDYQDVMDGVDYLIEKGIADKDKLYVTGGSAGGIMTAWIIGKNNRFKAAAVVKPVMNWISKTLTADNYYVYANYRYPGQPWENFKTYWKFSPISLVGNVQTPTMVMVGMKDLRTPPSEAKQLYHALKLRKIPTVMVEIPRAYHHIAARPSQLITKIAYILAWFERYP